MTSEIMLDNQVRRSVMVVPTGISAAAAVEVPEVEVVVVVAVLTVSVAVDDAVMELAKVYDV